MGGSTVGGQFRLMGVGVAEDGSGGVSRRYGEVERRRQGLARPVPGRDWEIQQPRPAT